MDIRKQLKNACSHRTNQQQPKRKLEKINKPLINWTIGRRRKTHWNNFFFQNRDKKKLNRLSY